MPRTIGDAIEKRQRTQPGWTDEDFREYLNVSEADWSPMKQEAYPDRSSPMFHPDLDQIANKYFAWADRLRALIGNIDPPA